MKTFNLKKLVESEGDFVISQVACAPGGVNMVGVGSFGGDVLG